jgi:glycosyltransferase involved in cell wall biosynthesis
VKIGFDAKRLFNNFTGLGNYSRFVLNALLEHAAENEYTLYTPKIRHHAEITQITQYSNVTVVTPSLVYRLLKATSLWRTWGIAKERSVSRLNVFHGLSQELPLNLPGNVKKVVTVHDLIFLRFPKLYNPIDVRIYKTKVKAACLSAHKIVAVSQQTAEDLMDFLGIAESKIKVVYQGCHPQFTKVVSAGEIDNVKRRYNLPDQYVLNVGTLEARKNIIVVVKALALLPAKSRLPLVIIGRQTAYKRNVISTAQQLGVMESIIFLHHVPFSDFPAVYQGAQLFLYPSLFEGFGIPLVEAIESGIPVITSTGSCFSEAAGPGSIYVDPVNEEELAFQLNRVLLDRELQQQMIIAGKKYTSRFASAQIAQELTSVYASL